MPPFAQPSARGCGPRIVSTFAEAATRAMERANSNSSLTDLDEEPCEVRDVIFAICLFVGYVGFLIFLAIWDLVSKSDFGWARRFASCCSSKARNAFTKIKSFAKRRESAPDASETVTMGAGASATNHGERKAARARPLCGPMSDVELVVTPFIVPFTECTGEGTCEMSCE